MLYTTNYNLKKPELTDNALIDQLNDNTDVIDAKFKTVFDNLGDAVKKDGTLQTGLNADTVDGKHASDFVSAENSIVKTESGKQSIYVGSNATVGDNGIANSISIQGQTDATIGGISFGNGGSCNLKSNTSDSRLYLNGKKLLNSDDYTSLFQFASNGKNSIANAITGKGISANSGMTFDQLASAISSIERFGYNTGSITYTIGTGGSSLFSLPSQAFNVLGWFVPQLGCGALRSRDGSAGFYFDRKVLDEKTIFDGFRTTSVKPMTSTTTVTWYAFGYYS